MNKIKEENFDSLLEKALEENFKEELASVKVEKFPLSKSFQNKMTSLIKKEEKRKRNLLKKVAIYLLIFAGATSLFVNNNQGAKAAFQSLWDWANEYRKITWLDDHIAIDVKRKDEDNIRVEFKEEFIPDGYELIKFQDLNKVKAIELINGKNTLFYITLTSTELTGSIGLDNEHIKYERKTINNRDYLIGIGENDRFGNLAITEYKGYYYEFHSYVSNIDEILDLAEKIFEKMENSL